MHEIKYVPKRIVHTHFKEPINVPIQPSAGKGIKGRVEVFEKFKEGLDDIEKFSHITLVYHFHLSRKYSLKVKPYMDERLRGVFATRAPTRPNPIGISTVKLVKREGNILHVEDIDMVDGTPLLDIKPYVPQFDEARIGWLEKRIGKLPHARDDGRFYDRGDKNL